jgi:hypothetical protein
MVRAARRVVEHQPRDAIDVSAPLLGQRFQRAEAVVFAHALGDE